MSEEEKEVTDEMIEELKQASVAAAKKKSEQAEAAKKDDDDIKGSGDSQPGAVATEVEDEETVESHPEKEGETETDSKDGDDTEDLIGSVADQFGLSYGQVTAIKRSKNPYNLAKLIAKADSKEEAHALVNEVKGHFDELSRKYGELGQKAADGTKRQPKKTKETADTDGKQKPPQPGNQDDDVLENIDERYDVPEDVKEALKRERNARMELQQQVHQVSTREFAERQQRGLQIFDQWKSQVAEEYPEYGELFGKQPIQEILANDPNSEQAVNAAKIIKSAEQMISSGAFDDAFKALDAAVSVHEPDLPLKAMAERIKKAADKQKKKVIGSGSGQQKRELDDRQKAIRVADQKLAEFGY
jgi:hypothetical protein